MLAAPTVVDEINDAILSKIGAELMRDNLEYQEANQKCTELYTVLKDNLAPEFHKHLANFEVAMLLMQGIATVTAYQQGFADGSDRQETSLRLVIRKAETPGGL